MDHVPSVMRELTGLWYGLSRVGWNAQADSCVVSVVKRGMLLIM